MKLKASTLHVKKLKIFENIGQAIGLKTSQYTLYFVVSFSTRLHKTFKTGIYMILLYLENKI